MSAPQLKRPFDNKVWYICWNEGKRSKRVSTRTTDMDAAKAFLGQWLLMERQELSAAGIVYTLDQLWMVYDAKHVQKRMAGPETATFNWLSLKPHFGHLSVSEITQDCIDLYVKKRTTGKIGRKVRESTVRKELQTLYACLRFCALEKHGQKLFDPRLISTTRFPDAAEPRDKWLRTDEVQRLLDGASKLRSGERLSRIERFLWLALETAGRKQALLDLTWDRVDFETNVIHLDVPGRKRTKKARASVPISKALLPILQRAYAERQNEYVLDSKAAVWASVQHAAIKAGFSDQKVAGTTKPKATGISPHVLRHTAATHMARRGVPLWKIAKVLGNTMIVVERTYAKHCPDDLRDAVDAISNGALEAAQ